MSETDKIPPSWVENGNKMVDEIWVPSEFHVKVFEDSGVKKEKIFKVPGGCMPNVVLIKFRSD